MRRAREAAGPWAGFVRPALVALVLTAAATSPAALPRGVSTASAAVIYVLAVTGASAIAGLRAGLIASVLSFVALNFFFTEPFHTLTVAHVDDLVALVVFLVVSGIVGTLLSVAVSQRARAERREREAVLLHHLGTRLLSGERIESILGSFAQALTEVLPIARCEVVTDVSVVVRERDGARPGALEEVPMVAASRRVGVIRLHPESPPGELGEEERNVVLRFAGHMGLAVESTRLGAEAAEARLEAESDRSRAALFSSVTHDLRTPLSSITASVTSLLEGGADFSPEDRRELLNTILEEAERLNRLVGNLLDLSRMRAGALSSAKEPAAIDELIEGVVARLEPLLRDHEVRLILRDDIPEIPMDVVQIDQMLTNILENAARFTPSGKRITVSAARLNGGVQIRISDQGPGIAGDDRTRVFEPFVRGEGSTGTGLGLAIASAIVGSHGGRIRAEEAPGGGAAIVVELRG